MTRFTVWAGTSPALAHSTQALEIVATASGSRLWQVVEGFDTIAVTETPSAVNGTPAVTALTNDTFLQAFQASSGVLWIGTRAAGAGNTAGRRNRDGTPEDGNQRRPRTCLCAGARCCLRIPATAPAAGSDKSPHTWNQVERPEL